MNGQNIVIFGAGETAHLAYEYFTHDSPHTVSAFCVDREYKTDDTFAGLPVVTTDEVTKLYPPEQFKAFASAGSGRLNRVRETIYHKAKSLGYGCVSYISSRAFVWHNVEIGENCFILEDNTLQPFTSIGNNVVLWSGNHIGHRTHIGDHAFITSHCVISGFCAVGQYCFMGVNASVADKVTIADNNFIGMATVINKNTQENGFYVGNPAELKSVSAKRFCKVG